MDFGDEQDQDQSASQVLVFMAVFLNRRLKIPLGFFPIANINARQKENLLKICLEHLFDTGVGVVGITFDGCLTNFTVANHLGCSTVYPDVNPNFKYEFAKDSSIKDLLIFPDPCHMLKNIRNCLGEKGPIIDGNGGSIDWRYLEKLVKLQEEEQLHLGNKLKATHIYFSQHKMNVR